MTGLREAQKQATRAALRAHALRLFAQRGFRGTTIGEIAAAAKVSPRTFFLHFTSKEDVLLEQVDEHLAQLRAALAESPATPEPLDRIEHVFVRMAAELERRDDLPLQLELLETVPSLLGAHFERFQAFGEAIGEAVEGWLGCASHPDREPYVRLVATVSLAAVWAAILSWYDEHAHAGEPVEPGVLPRMMSANFAAVRTGLTAPTTPGAVGNAGAVASAGAVGNAVAAPGAVGGGVVAGTGGVAGAGQTARSGGVGAPSTSLAAQGTT